MTFCFLTCLDITNEKHSIILYIVTVTKGPGTFVVVQSPSGIQGFMNGGREPILQYMGNLIPIGGNLTLPTIAISVNDTLSGFVHHGVMVRVTQVNPFHSPCTGRFCNWHGLVNDGQVRDSCACFQMMSSRRAMIGFSLNLMITLADGTEFEVLNFTDRYFIETFMISGTPPVNMTVEEVGGYRRSRQINNAINGVIDMVNGNGGWLLTGWAKPGTVQDQAANPAPGAPPVYNAQPVLIQAGTLRYHITRLDPEVPMSINPQAIENLKVNLNQTAPAPNGNGNAV